MPESGLFVPIVGASQTKRRVMIGISRMANRAKYILLNLVSSKMICLFLDLSLEGETHGDRGCHVKKLGIFIVTYPLILPTKKFGKEKKRRRPWRSYYFGRFFEEWMNTGRAISLLPTLAFNVVRTTPTRKFRGWYFNMKPKGLHLWRQKKHNDYPR